MSLSGYRVFTKIVETGSLAGAARDLHLSPSAVSKQLSTLEQRLGATLIQRSTRSVQVTEIGERFYSRCAAILGSVDEAETEVQEVSQEAAGRLRVTLPQSLACAQFAALLGDFQQQHPAIKIDLSVSNSVVNLIENKVDVAFRAGTLEDSRLIATPLFSAKIVLCASPDYLRQNTAPGNLKELNEHTLLVPSSHYLPDAMQSVSRESVAGASYPNYTNYTNYTNYSVCEDLGLLVEFLKAGQGIGLLWDYFAQAHISAGYLKLLKSPIHHAPRPLSMIHLSRDYVPKRLERFLQFFKTHYRS